MWNNFDTKFNKNFHYMKIQAVVKNRWCRILQMNGIYNTYLQLKMID